MSCYVLVCVVGVRLVFELIYVEHPRWQRCRTMFLSRYQDDTTFPRILDNKIFREIIRRLSPDRTNPRNLPLLLLL